MAKNKSTIRLDEVVQIKDYLASRTISMSEYIEQHSESTYILWSKNLTHSDLVTRGKRSGAEQSLDKNLLYYLSSTEMKIIEENTGKLFESAKQSNIGLPKRFFDDINVEKLDRRKGHQKTQHPHKSLNEQAEVYLVNDTIKYFTMSYTKKVFDGLEKTTRWNDKDTVSLEDGSFTSIQISQAIHGLGIAEDKEFDKLRSSMFLNDTIAVLIEKRRDSIKLFFMLEKNPRFFTIIGETNATWEKYLLLSKQQERRDIDIQQGLTEKEEKSRKQQYAWKTLLAKEMMNYTTHEGEVFCPFTQINADFETVPMLFIASHIKRFVDSDTTEAYDVNNGLLLCANADALFDKHMITVDENKKLKFSFLLENNWQLKQKLLLNQPIFELILNEKRMEYMAEHRNMFEEKELKRRTI